MGKQYHKIQSIFKRDEKGRFTNEFSRPEFGYLFHNNWVCEEKIDGTNIRVIWDGPLETVSFKGRTNKAQIPAHLLEMLENKFTPDRMREVFGRTDGEITLYGEGFGHKIQKNGSKYIPDGTDFCLFDILIGPYYLKRLDVKEIANKLDILSAPEIGTWTLNDAIHYIKNVANCEDILQSEVAQEDIEAEGLVLRPETDLYDRRGQRIITKLKVSDFRK